MQIQGNHLGFWFTAYIIHYSDNLGKKLQFRATLRDCYLLMLRRNKALQI